MSAAKWLQGKNMRVKGNPLCWHTACAPRLMQYSNEEILRRQLERIRQDVTAYWGVMDLWDVINEVVIMPVFNKYDNAVTRICRAKGRIRLVKEVFAAKESNPDAVLLINDFNTSAAYEILLEELLESGVPVGAIGIQSHQHQGYWGLEKLNDLIHGAWETHETLITDEEGNLSFTGFKGSYIIKANSGQAALVLNQDRSVALTPV